MFSNAILTINRQFRLCLDNHTMNTLRVELDLALMILVFCLVWSKLLNLQTNQKVNLKVVFQLGHTKCIKKIN